ncbi:MAG: hypothetical protein BWZ02_02643 [Lentisphaerae bacterium ADurb.BinA184]|nr:MAG: hypothetical protein BWZ02_02643 [Lentisphaerae bacterium ADurb.BinA184]
MAAQQIEVAAGVAEQVAVAIGVEVRGPEVLRGVGSGGEEDPGPEGAVAKAAVAPDAVDAGRAVGDAVGGDQIADAIAVHIARGRLPVHPLEVLAGEEVRHSGRRAGDRRHLDGRTEKIVALDRLRHAVLAVGHRDQMAAANGRRRQVDEYVMADLRPRAGDRFRHGRLAQPHVAGVEDRVVRKVDRRRPSAARRGGPRVARRPEDGDGRARRRVLRTPQIFGDKVGRAGRDVEGEGRGEGIVGCLAGLPVVVLIEEIAGGIGGCRLDAEGVEAVDSLLGEGQPVDAGAGGHDVRKGDGAVGAGDGDDAGRGQGVEGHALGERHVERGDWHGRRSGGGDGEDARRRRVRGGGGLDDEPCEPLARPADAFAAERTAFAHGAGVALGQVDEAVVVDRRAALADEERRVGQGLMGTGGREDTGEVAVVDDPAAFVERPAGGGGLAAHQVEDVVAGVLAVGAIGDAGGLVDQAQGVAPQRGAGAGRGAVGIPAEHVFEGGDQIGDDADIVGAVGEGGQEAAAGVVGIVVRPHLEDVAAEDEEAVALRVVGPAAVAREVGAAAPVGRQDGVHAAVGKAVAARVAVLAAAEMVQQHGRAVVFEPDYAGVAADGQAVGQGLLPDRLPGSNQSLAQVVTVHRAGVRPGPELVVVQRARGHEQGVDQVAGREGVAADPAGVERRHRLPGVVGGIEAGQPHRSVGEAERVEPFAGVVGEIVVQIYVIVVGVAAEIGGVEVCPVAGQAAAGTDAIGERHGRQRLPLIRRGRRPARPQKQDPTPEAGHDGTAGTGIRSHGNAFLPDSRQRAVSPRRFMIGSRLQNPGMSGWNGIRASTGFGKDFCLSGWRDDLRVVQVPLQQAGSSGLTWRTRRSALHRTRPLLSAGVLQAPLKYYTPPPPEKQACPISRGQS